MTATITSLRHPRVQHAVRLHRRRHRRTDGLILLDGPNVVDAAARAGVELVTMFMRDGEDSGVQASETFVVSESVLQKVSQTPHPRGPVAIAVTPDSPMVGSHVLLLWGVADPGNVGTIIRSAAAFGWSVGMGPDCADAWSPKTLRAGAGAQFTTPVIPMDFDDLGGRPLVATTPRAGADVADWDWREPVAVAIGSEAHGLPEELLARADSTISIRHTDAVESLNAAVAAGILLYAIAESRTEGDD